MSKRRARAADQLDLLADRGSALAEEFLPPRRSRARRSRGWCRRGRCARPRRRRCGPAPQVVDTGELASHTDRPGDRCAGIPSTRSISSSSSTGARPSRSSLLMNVMIGVSRRRQTSISLIVRSSTPLAQSMTMSAESTAVSVAVGVLGEVLVAGRVEQVDDAPAVRELHDRGGDRDAALLLEPHPVRGRVTRRLAPLDRARHLDRAAEEQQLLGERGLAGVRVRDDREAAAAGDFLDRGHLRAWPRARAGTRAHLRARPRLVVAAPRADATRSPSAW